MAKLDKLSLRDAFQCYGYAFNVLFLGPRFAEHLIRAGMPRTKAYRMGREISDELRYFAEQHARNMLRRGLLVAETPCDRKVSR